MSIKVDVTSADLARQIELLKYYPEVVEKHFKSELYRAAALVKKEIQPDIPRMTGKAQKTFRSRVTGKGIYMQAQIGWWGSGSAWYINIVEHGASPHSIGYKGIGNHILVRGQWKTKKEVKGFAGRKFMAQGYERSIPRVTALMAGASERVVNEMAVK